MMINVLNDIKLLVYSNIPYGDVILNVAGETVIIKYTKDPNNDYAKAWKNYFVPLLWTGD